MGVIHDSYGRGIDTLNPLPIKEDKTYITPVEVQARLNQTIQTHSGVTVAATTGTNDSAWIDCDGFGDVSIMQLNDNSSPTHLHVYWSHDNGTSTHGLEMSVLTGTSQYKSTQIPIKARHIKIRLSNTDAAPHVMSAWIYLKA